jgi:hypothetical protein
MKKFLVATTALALMCAPALAPKHDGSASQGDNMTKPVNMRQGSMKKGTTGMSNDGGMAKSGMKPDASGQGGSGPGSDQGGTKTTI